jgi:hypothetical protein
MRCRWVVAVAPEGKCAVAVCGVLAVQCIVDKAMISRRSGLTRCGQGMMEPLQTRDSSSFLPSCKAIVEPSALTSQGQRAPWPAGPATMPLLLAPLRASSRCFRSPLKLVSRHVRNDDCASCPVPRVPACFFCSKLLYYLLHVLR